MSTITVQGKIIIYRQQINLQKWGKVKIFRNNSNNQIDIMKKIKELTLNASDESAQNFCIPACWLEI
jgi:hypothetical protein